MKPIIEAKNLTKKFEDFIAVNSISFNVNKCEIFGFLGPNGAGKTTTINMLTGMAKITSGEIYYKNEDVTKRIKKAQELIGVVADESNLYAEMSGFDNLCFCASLYGIPRKIREERALELLRTFQLDHVANKKFAAYSKGMKRKLTIAAALIHKPEILFLDEPTTGIDIASVRQIRNLIKNLNETGTTIFLTTHYIEEAERLCDRVAFIDQGRIIKIDTVQNLLEATKESQVIEVVFEENKAEKKMLLDQLTAEFPNVECTFKNSNTIKVISSEKIDISPIVAFFSARKIFVYEARMIQPTLEDAFVKLTGIQIDLLKKEKEKK